ncbi:MAG TPA: hypothetical protein VNN08_11645 [Thermoanaerobaculia bacterium]|nr:hypothetical protein [Thermoanaerobaculia bacterium]
MRDARATGNGTVPVPAIVPHVEVPAANAARQPAVSHLDVRHHLDEETLAGCALLAAETSGDEEAFAHLGECAECTVRLNGIRALYHAITFHDSWEAGHARKEQLLAVAARAQQEYLQARAALSSVVANQVTFIRERVEAKDEFRTSGAVRVLAEAANAICEREPIHARNLAVAAVAIAGSLPEGAYPPVAICALRGLAWKELANALRRLADYGGALEALDHAAGEFEHFGTHAFELATLAMQRSVVLTSAGRLEEATQEAAKSAAIFAEYGDAARAARARSMEASLLYDRGQYGAAAAMFEALMASAKANDDDVETARQAFNVAACSIELGDGARAEELLAGAKETYRARGMDAEVARTDWGLGVAARVSGRVEESVSLLRAAKVSVESFGTAHEAATISLDLIESLLLLGRRREIASLCSDVKRHYRRAGKVLPALTAADFLKEGGKRHAPRRDGAVRTTVRRRARSRAGAAVRGFGVRQKAESGRLKAEG